MLMPFFPDTSVAAACVLPDDEADVAELALDRWAKKRQRFRTHSGTSFAICC